MSENRFSDEDKKKAQENNEDYEHSDLKIKEYQTRRESLLLKDKENLIANYMELTIQIGYVLFFSSVFPLAGVLSVFSNFIQLRS